MAINKVVYDGNTLIDLSNDTLDAAGQIGREIVAHTKAGERIVGTNPYNAENVGAALSASLAALAKKGVSASGNEDIDDLAGMIAKIPVSAGGDLPAGVSGIARGEFTLTDSSATKNVTHGLGIKPNFYMVARENSTVSQSSITIISFGLLYTATSSQTTYVMTRYYNASGNITTGGKIGVAEDFSGTRVTLRAQSSSFPFAAGKKYIWIVGLIDGIL